MNALITRYKRYRQTGGNILRSQQEVKAATGTINNLLQTGADAIAPGSGQLIGAVSSLQSNLVDAFDKKDENGVGSKFGELLKATGPAGLPGAIIGATSYYKMKAESNSLSGMKRMAEKRMFTENLAQRRSLDPTLLTGNANTSYYKYGGNMANSVPSSAGTSLSSTAVEFKGPSHAEGGVQLPNLNAEVEGKETANAGYVFSDKLGFAKLHKPIAKAIGKIEQKAMRPERITSLELLKKKENQLKEAQEYIRSIMGVKD